MVSKENLPSKHETAEFYSWQLVDDRQDYIIASLNNIINSKESSLEYKVFAFEKSGDIYWNYKGDLYKALQCFNNAIELADSLDTGFISLLGGSIWRKKLQLLSLLEKNDEIEGELEKVINKYINKEYKSNSYLFNAYKYKADVEYKKCNFKTALEHLQTAQLYYPIRFYGNMLHVIEISDYKDEYDNLECLLSRNVCCPNDWEI